MTFFLHHRSVLFASVSASLMALSGVAFAAASDDEIFPLLERHCLDCHDELSTKGNLDLYEWLDHETSDGTLLFENLITSKMPPADKPQPTAEDKLTLLHWLSQRQAATEPQPFRRITRHEFVNAINDLLGTQLDLSDQIPEDRGTRDFDSDRRIALSREMLTSYFSAADQLLENALPSEGVPAKGIWVTNKLKDSHKTYNIYHRLYEDGVLFSWTRVNNGNSYSFFYDNFDPPVAGWYDLTFDAAMIGEFEGAISVEVFAGKYYYADDRPQLQRMLGVLSLTSTELKPHRIRVYLHPGENVSIHCYSPENFRDKELKRGAYIKQLTAEGPVIEAWPPASYTQLFPDLPIDAPPRPTVNLSDFPTNLEIIGGSLTVSSFQEGMEKEYMQDGSNRTFWHTRFKPDEAKPPHYVIVENPRRALIEGLNYATWSGGNGNGQIEAYEILTSDDGETWSELIAEGELEIRLANEQPITFSKPTSAPFLKFLVTRSFSLKEEQSLASIGKLDAIISQDHPIDRVPITIDSRSPEALSSVIDRFAERAFASELTENELAPYREVSLNHLEEHGNLVEAARVGFKAILCSPRFLMAPGEHRSAHDELAANLSRSLWLSVPDETLMELARSGELKGPRLRKEIDRMIQDKKSDRMIRSFSDQWLNLRSWNKVTPSLKLYPKYDDLLDFYLPRETRTYLTHLIRENRPVSELIDSDYSFLNQRLASHYGLPPMEGQELRRVSFSPDAPRGGLLTMGSVLKVTTDGYETSPILRGAWISKNIVGTPLSPPPPEVEVIEPEHGENAATLREQIEQHKKSQTCYACHKSIDPYGFALENFDPSGQWRTRYRVETAHQGTFTYRPRGFYKEASPVDASGEIHEQPFDDIFGLKAALLEDPRKIAYNYAKKLFEYATGKQPTLPQRLALYQNIPEETDYWGLKDLTIDVLIFALTEAQP